MASTKSSQSNIHNKQAARQLPDSPLDINRYRLNHESRGGNIRDGEYNQPELELRRQSQQLAAAGEIAHMAISTLDLDLLLSSSLELIREMFSYYHASVFLVDSESNMVVLHESTGEAGRQLKAGNHKLAVGSNSLVGLATASRQPVIVQDVTSDPTHFNNPLLPETRAEAVIPLLIGSVVVGALDVQSTITDSFSASNVTILTIIADQLSVAIQNARLYASLQQELTQRRGAEQALQFAKEELEIRVEERTADLSQANTQLETELAERKQAEGALQKSESLLQAVFDNSGIGVALTDLNGRFIKANQAYLQMLGYGETELYALKADNLTYSDDLNANQALRTELLAGRSNQYVIEKRYIHKDGGLVWVRNTVSMILDQQGQPHYLIAISEDITERKRVELVQDVVYQIAQATNQELSLNELAETIHQSIQKVMMADNFYIAIHDGKTDIINYLYVVDQYDDEISLAKSGKSMTAYVLRSGESLLAKDAAYQELLKAGEIELVGTPSPVWLGVPLRIQGEAIGVMVVQDYQNESAYGEREKQLLEYVSSQVAISIQRKQTEAALRESEERSRLITDNMRDLVFQTNSRGVIQYASPSFKPVLGYEPGELLGQTIFQQIHPEDLGEILKTARSLHARPLTGRVEFRLPNADGKYVWLEAISNPIFNGKNKFIGSVISSRVITERKEAENLQQVVYEIAQATNQELSLEELFATIHKSIQKIMIADNFYIAVYDSKTDILSFPYSVDQFDGEFFPARPGRSMTAYVLRTGQPLLCTLAAHQKLLDNEEIDVVGTPSQVWLGVPLGIQSKPIGVMAVQDYQNESAYGQREQQILEYVSSQVAMSIQRKQAEERLAHDALHDGLTGLPNRTLFLDRLEHAVRKIERSVETTFAVLFLDIDRFKLVNDSLGHAFGDQLLIEIGERLKTCLRPGDTVARLGGDEFVILLEDMIDAAEATHIANRIQSELSSPFHLEGHELTTTASIGIAMSSTEYDLAEDLLRDADIAMYRAKTTGKARQEIFDTGMHAAVSSLLHLEADLRQAIEKQEFQVYYQPLVSMTNGRIVGTEALLRWQHPTRGLLPPAAFITVLEETGMIIPVGEWILRAACIQNKIWQASGYPHLRVAVNFSARQFHIKNLAEMVESVLNQTGMDPATLELEITESTAMKDVDLTLRTLNELHATGVGISLDDFGRGYSALSYLNKYPFQSLKADRSFIMDIPHDSNDMGITAAIIAMAHSLKLRVVAEGVETQEQLHFLGSHKCDEVQGFLFSRPVPAQELSGLLQKKNLLSVSKTRGKKVKA